MQAQPTSYYRTIAHNADVGGADQSQHLLGYALDVVPAGSSSAADLVAVAHAAGLVAIDEGDHVHWHLVPVSDATRGTLRQLLAAFAR